MNEKGCVGKNEAMRDCMGGADDDGCGMGVEPSFEDP
jgi:hypothetical protein